MQPEQEAAIIQIPSRETGDVIHQVHARSLEGADLSSAPLKGARLAGVNLTGANLTGAILTGADLHMANLQGADLSTAALDGADLSYANLSGSNLRLAQLQGARLAGADLTGAKLERANLEGADLRHAVLTGAALEGAHLEGALLPSPEEAAADPGSLVPRAGEGLPEPEGMAESHRTVVPDDFPRGEPPPLRSQPAHPSALEKAVLAALDADPRVNASLIRVRVESGEVYLAGRQDNEAAREAAIEVAAHVPGVLAVIPDIEVLPSV